MQDINIYSRLFAHPHNHGLFVHGRPDPSIRYHLHKEKDQ